MLIGRKVGNAEREWYAYLPGSLLRLGQHAPDGTLIAHLHDFQHSLRATLDAQGRTQPYAYTAFGVPLSVAQHPVFGVAGELHAPLSGLVSLRARWYDPDSGTLLTTDPYHGDWQQPYGHHPYQYAYSNPLRFADPSGMITTFMVLGGYGTEVAVGLQHQLLHFLGSENVIDASRTIVTEPGGNIGRLISMSGIAFNQMSEYLVTKQLAEIIREIHKGTCDKEPIVLIGYSRGGALVQRVAGMLTDELPGAHPIDLLVTIGPVNSPDSYNAMFPVQTKQTSVRRHINFISEQGYAVNPFLPPEPGSGGWFFPMTLPALHLTDEFSVNGAENFLVVGSDHLGISKQYMPIFTKSERTEKYTYTGRNAYPNPIFPIIEEAIRPLLAER